MCDIICEVCFFVIRGNVVEIVYIVGVIDWLIKGVDVGEDGGDIIWLV